MKAISLYERLQGPANYPTHIHSADDPDHINFEENKINPVYQKVVGNY